MSEKCERCGNPAYASGEQRPLCDSCLDWVYFRHKAYKPEGAGYLTGEDLTDIELQHRSLREVLQERGLLSPTVIVAIPESKILPAIIRECDEELISWLVRHPEQLYSIHPGTFERIIAEIFKANGFEVELISSWNQPDGGVDLIAVQRVFGLDEIRVAIQCKRHAKTRRVSAEPIRSLHGVLDRFKAHKGVVAITSEFTREAWQEAHEYFWHINLMDHKGVLSALQKLRLIESRRPDEI